MALIPENERLGCFRHWVNTILMDAKATSISERDILHIWLEKDATGIYRGSGTVVLKGHDTSVAGLKGNTTRTYMNAPNYPNPKCHIQLSYMCCNRCKILDHHNTVDCTYHPPPLEQQEVQEQSSTSSSNATTVSKNKTSNSTIMNSPISVTEQPVTTVPKVVPATIDLDSTESDEDTQQKKTKRGGNKEDQQQKDDDNNEEKEELDTALQRPEKRLRWTVSKRTRQ
ncbi:hypothetical protein BDC45DRAFT_511422 [Circinella umbellata]|nr:hypothetical protein BDC45DRAFT_511422 [Circinella umbellata]